MVRIAVVEDDKQHASLLLDYIKKYFSESKTDYISDVYFSGMDLLKNYTAKYDIVFMDIEMPIMDGMETARKLRKIDSSVALIFVTNMAQFAVSGYEVDAIGYLVKPYTYFGFNMNLKKALKQINSRESVDIIITTRQGITVLPTSELLYIEIRKHDLIYFTEKDTIINRGTLKGIEEQLEKNNFARCNNCYLVNMKFVRSVVNNTVALPGRELSMSRGKKKEFLDKFMRYLGGGETNVRKNPATN